MGNAIGNVLPSALTIAVSPFPIIALILMLLSSKIRSTSTAFLVGWVVGLAAVSVIVSTFSGNGRHVTTVYDEDLGAKTLEQQQAEAEQAFFLHNTMNPSLTQFDVWTETAEKRAILVEAHRRFEARSGLA